MDDLTAPMQTRPVLADRYVLGEELGRGGAATVYGARDRLLGREVAVKLFTANAVGPEEVHRQESEARLVARLNHYALTTLLDAGVDTSVPERPRIFLVMEHVPGADLKRRLRAGALTPMQVAYLGFDLSEALHYVHEHGYLHRDIKPANVLISSVGESTRVRAKLTDFGISSIIGAEQGEFTTGTAAYLAPEQVEGLDATTATDVYALGLVLLEGLTGVVEFPGDVEHSAFARLDRDPVVPDWIPEGIASVLHGMLLRDPAARIPLPEAAEAFQHSLITTLIEQRRLDPGLVPADERERVAALHRFDVLGEAEDEAFDRVTYLATRLLRVPVAFVSLVDTDRKVIRSARGLTTTLREVDRDEALCAVPVATGRPAQIPDVLLDARIARNPIVAAGGVRSYAAAPLVTHDGHSIGALGVFDSDVRRFGDDELYDLAELAAVIMRELELRLASRRVALGR